MKMIKENDRRRGLSGNKITGNYQSITDYRLFVMFASFWEIFLGARELFVWIVENRVYH